jgi:hypothetical protein
MRGAGLGTKTRQYNPATEGAKTVAQWVTAVLAMKGESDAMPVGEAVDIIRATPHSRRSKFAKEIWSKRRRGNPRDPLQFIADQLTRKQKDFYLGQYDYWLNVEGATEEKSERYALEDLFKKFPGLKKKANPFDWREQREHGGSGSLFDAIRHGDRVTFVDRFGKSHTGKAVMRGPYGWVLNMGGRHGTPAVVNEDMVTQVRGGNPAELDNPAKTVKRLHILYSPVNAAYFLMWHGSILRILPTKAEAKAEMEYLLRHSTESERNPRGRTVPEILRECDKLRAILRQRNPDDGELREAERLYETFHGREPREILAIQESSETRGEYTALGDLIELTMISPTGDTVLVSFKGDGVRLASSPEGEQLYLIGGNQDLSSSLRMFGADEAKDLIDLGEAKQIVYEAAKWQTDFTAQEWKHDFGEEGGVRPRGFYDQLKQRIFFAGGTYQVKRPGIVD